jgi:hypothetical protein
MTAKFAKVAEIAERYRVSVDAVYLWIRQGKIPSDCVIRIAGTVRVDEEQFERQLRAGALYRPRKRNSRIETSSEDSFTTIKTGPRIDHRWTDESGAVEPHHPYGPERAATR